MSKHQAPDTRHTDAYTDAALERIGLANRPFARDFIRQRRNEGLRPKSTYGYVQAILHLDRFLDGRPLASVTAADLTGFVEALRASMKSSTVFGTVFKLRRVLRDLLDVDWLPKDLGKALHVKEPRQYALGRLIAEAEFFALLKATRDEGSLGTLVRMELSQAVLWTLWDSGFRASELLSLNVGDVRFEDHRGAQLSLRPEAPDLKTGARTIYVSECVGPLRAWLEMHPAGDDPKAPLFTGFYDRSGYRRMNYQRLHEHIRTLGERSGVNANSSRTKCISPHDFRHTCATRKARARWMEAELRAFFGWAPGSAMPSHYVHLALGDMRERVRRDAGVDDNGYQQAVEAGDDARALAALIAKMANPAKPGAQTQKPAPWQLT